MTIRIEVQGSHNAEGERICTEAAALGVGPISRATWTQLYFLEHDPGPQALSRLCSMLLVDPVTESATWSEVHVEPAIPSNVHWVEVSMRPGVTDVVARELARGMLEIGLPDCDTATGARYLLEGDLTEEEVRLVARQLLCNETVQHYSLGAIVPHFGGAATPTPSAQTIALSGLDETGLLRVSKERLLSLDASEMRAIQLFYQGEGREPTDVELETLAQTWSEHCVHKTFRALIDFQHLDAQGRLLAHDQIDGLLRSYIRRATEQLNPHWLHSAFVDNAGLIAFDDQYDLAFKVETHNHPSALEPFGGANTGIGGVVRDILGVSARPIATTDVLCFGPQNVPHKALPAGVLHPRRVGSGVVAGVADYGNKLGLPTANGAVIYDEGFLGNPLVFCGCVGLLPVGGHPTQAVKGDLIVALGGRTGRDGLHGATFSSAELTHETSETAGSAVQIGDPITEKGLIEVIELARDRGLYHAITDCGAGGFSSAIGEMGNQLGAQVELANAPLKYAGLAPWEIWLSEAQERMVLAVGDQQLSALQDLCRLWDVELSVLGRFTGDGRLRVTSSGDVVADLPMQFLHDGLPRRTMAAVHCEPQPAEPLVEFADPGSILLAMLACPTIASKEAIVRRYDHEVRGGTLVRPFTGPHMDGPTDAAVLKPLGTWRHPMAFALSVGINPEIGKVDPYAMAVSAVDEAMRNLVAVGADPDRVAILDNFCWGNPTLPDRLGSLVRACQGCYDAALAYQTPFISGKDSLYNEFNGKPIPGTLLISAIALVPDVAHCVTSDLKEVGNRLYLVGETRPELGGSLLYALHGKTGGVAPAIPDSPLARYRQLHASMRAGLVRSCHDLSEGGLVVALAEMAIGGRLGIEVDLEGMQPVGLETKHQLFAESNGRLLVEVRDEHGHAFETCMENIPLSLLGHVAPGDRLNVNRAGAPVLSVSLGELLTAWKGESA